MTTFNFEYLYHTTTILNEKSINIVTDIGRCKYHAEWEKFPTCLKAGKFFTITPRCDYHSDGPVTDYVTHLPVVLDQVYLKYKLKRDVKLMNNIGGRGHPNDQEIKDYDGFYEIGDCIEIYLKSPEDFLDPEFEMINFCDRKDRCIGDYHCQVMFDKHKH
jgi:hypothetical protein